MLYRSRLHTFEKFDFEEHPNIHCTLHININELWLLFVVVSMMWCLVHVWGTQYIPLTTIHPISNVYFLFLASRWVAMLIYKEWNISTFFYSTIDCLCFYSFSCPRYKRCYLWLCIVHHALCIPCIFIEACTTSHIPKSIGGQAANNRNFCISLFAHITMLQYLSLISLLFHIFFWWVLETISFWSIRW